MDGGNEILLLETALVIQRRLEFAQRSKDANEPELSDYYEALAQRIAERRGIDREEISEVMMKAISELENYDTEFENELERKENN